LQHISAGATNPAALLVSWGKTTATFGGTLARRKVKVN
jgi:hypothetical protein